MNETELEVPADQLKAMQVLTGALVAGPILFLVAVAVIGAMQPEPAQRQPLENIQLFSTVHAFVAFGCVAMSVVLFKLRFTNQPPPAGLETPAEVVEEGLSVLRAAQVLRMALLEGPALFGGVVCFLAATGGLLREHPVIWLNALTTLVLVVVTAATFPTETRVRALIAERWRRGRG